MATLSNAEVFRGAAGVLARSGWVQKSYGAVGTPRCIGGALSEASGEATHWPGTTGSLYDCQVLLGSRIVGRQVDQSDAICALVEWNNAPGRTKEQAIAALIDLAFDEDLKAAATEGGSPKVAQINTIGNLPTPETGALVSQPQLVEA